MDIKHRPDLYAQGYVVSKVSYRRGYVSRKAKIDDLPVQVSKRGKYYIDCPCRISSRYVYRVYFEKKGGEKSESQGDLS